MSSESLDNFETSVSCVPTEMEFSEKDKDGKTSVYKDCNKS